MEGELRLIQGHIPGSKEEVWIANALDATIGEDKYIFQYEVAGGIRVRGGMVVDFMLLHPRLTPLEVYGDYWHESELPGADLLRVKALEQIFHVKPLIVWGKDIPDQAAAHRWVEKNVL